MPMNSAARTASPAPSVAVTQPVKMPPRMMNGIRTAYRARQNARPHSTWEKRPVLDSYRRTRLMAMLVRMMAASTMTPGMAAALNKVDAEMPSVSPMMM